MTSVVVDGDVTVDWNLAHGWRGDEVIGHDDIRAYHQAGGAALLAELVAQVAGRSRQVIEVARPPDPDEASPDDPRVHHSWALWSRAPRAVPAGGWNACLVSRAQPATRPRNGWKRTPPAWSCWMTPGSASVTGRTAGLPPSPADPGPWVLVKMSAPVAAGALWEHLLRWHRDRLVVVVRVEDLRRSQVQISRGLSWERTTQDLAWELPTTPMSAGYRSALTWSSCSAPPARLSYRARTRRPPRPAGTRPSR